jgi:site-specific DNA-cytosine methylase
MNVLSLFDGMSCARIALDRAGIKYENYFASEIDKYAVKVAMANYPSTIQLGDVTKWQDWNLPKISTLVAGFPCQAWSVAGKQKGLEDSRGALALVLLDIFNHLKSINPNIYFLFENVRMKKENLDFMDNLFGTKHIMINSALVSAQNRVRCYWTNIPNVTQPSDKGILLKDIIESGEVDRDKSYCIDANYFKGGSLKNYIEKSRRQVVLNQGERRLQGFEPMDSCVRIGEIGKGGQGAKTGLYLTNNTVRKLTPLECEKLQTVPENFTNHVSDTQRYKMLGNGFTVDVIAYILKQINSL